MSPLLAALGLSYLAGSFPTAYVVVKWLKQVDVRTVGSGNVGATNVTRAAGLKAGLAVFVVDAAKGAAATCLIAPGLLPGGSPALRLACGLAAIVGHNFPVFLGFRGGKGVATTIGVMISTMPAVAGVCLAVWVAAFAPWRYVSVASIAAALALPVAQWAWQATRAELGLGAAMAGLLIARHHANIRRLLQGTESRMGARKRAS